MSQTQNTVDQKRVLEQKRLNNNQVDSLDVFVQAAYQWYKELKNENDQHNAVDEIKSLILQGKDYSVILQRYENHGIPCGSTVCVTSSLVKMISELIYITNVRNIVSVGCGKGYLEWVLSKATEHTNVIGVEYGTERKRFCKVHPNISSERLTFQYTESRTYGKHRDQIAEVNVFASGFMFIHMTASPWKYYYLQYNQDSIYWMLFIHYNDSNDKPTDEDFSQDFGIIRDRRTNIFLAIRKSIIPEYSRL